MIAKEYLRQIRLLDLKITHRIEERDTLRSMAAGMSGQGLGGERTGSSAPGDRMAQIVNRYVDMEKEIDAMIDELVELRDKIIGQIHQLEDRRYVELLYLRYVKYMRLEEIACTMHKTDGSPYSYDHINRLHGEALENFTEKFIDSM